MSVMQVALPKRAEQRIWNKRAGDSSTPCFVCGRPTDGSRNILLDESCGGIIPADTDELAVPNGGWFDVGPECARKLPKTHVKVVRLTIERVPGA